jgi:ribosome-associated protein
LIQITHTIVIPEHEIEFHAIRASGPGGQNVNKVSSAIHLRFDIKASSLPDELKQRLLALHDQRISRNGVINIKAQSLRSQEQNREDALARLKSLIQQAQEKQKRRVPTRPGRASRQRRLDKKTRHGRKKELRRKIF